MTESLRGPSRPKGGPRRLLLPALLVLLLSARLVLLIPIAAKPERSLTTDSRGYLNLAQSLRTKGTFEADNYTEATRTPGYPLFLAAVQSVFGGIIVPAIAVQVLLSIGVAGLVLVTGTVATRSSVVGWAAAFLWALNPSSIFWPLTILSETLFAVLLAAGLLILVVAMRRESLLWYGSSGLILGAAVLVRPIGIYLIPLWMAALLARGLRRQGWRRGWQAAVMLGLAASSPVFGWAARNQHVHGQFYFSEIQTTTVRGFMLARALADARGLTRSEAAQTISDSSDLGEWTRQILLESPWSIPKVIVAGVARTALGTESQTWASLAGFSGASRGFLTSLLAGDWSGTQEGWKALFGSLEGAPSSVLTIWGGVYALVVWLAAMVGWLRNHARLDRTGVTAWWLAALSVVYLVASPLANGDARFRLPADPYLAFLGAIFLLGQPALARRMGPGKEIPSARMDPDRSSHLVGERQTASLPRTTTGFSGADPA